MAKCELLETCVKKKHCLADPDSCARIRIVHAIGRAHVPGDLFPNDVGRAQRLIEERR